MTAQVPIDVLLALIGSIIFLAGSIAYTIDAALKKDPLKCRNIWYLVGSVLFVIGCKLFIVSSVLHLFAQNVELMTEQD